MYVCIYYLFICLLVMFAALFACVLSDVSLCECQEHEVAQLEAQPTQGSLDGAVPAQAQEGNAGGGAEETHTAHGQVPARHHRRYAQRYPRETKPEA